MQPKLPICYFDARTGILCGNCESRLAKGEITQADVDASKAVAHLSDRVVELQKATLKRAFETKGSYVLEFEASDVPSLRSNPLLLEELENALKGRAYVVGAGGSERRFLEDVFFPARVLTVNTVYLPDGEKKTKVIVPARRSERRIGDFDKLREAVKRARGIDLLVETEREVAASLYS
ncbi:MAG: transcription elongation factor NusA [Nitrososphaerota archaeon]|nr:transcription elongation factor NusA [Nitrososphaerota archaeon]